MWKICHLGTFANVYLLDLTNAKIGILLPKLFWLNVRKIVLVMEKKFEIRG